MTGIDPTGLDKKFSDKRVLYGGRSDITKCPTNKKHVANGESTATLRDSQTSLKDFKLFKIKIDIFRARSKQSSVTVSLFQGYTALVLGAVALADVEAALCFVWLLDPRESIAL